MNGKREADIKNAAIVSAIAALKIFKML